MPNLFDPAPNKPLQLTRAARGALQDRWHFGTITGLSKLYPGAGN
jgi:hypothetical protein